MLTALKTLFASPAPAAATASVAAPVLAPLSEDEVREQSRIIRQAWKKAARAKNTSAASHAAYALWRGQDIRRAFSPITHPSKIISNGNDPYFALNRALQELSMKKPEAFAPWAELLAEVPRDNRGRYAGPHPLLDAIATALATRSRLS